MIPSRPIDDTVTQFLSHCRHNKDEEALKLLLKDATLVHSRDFKDRTALMLACHYGHPGIVYMLLQWGASIQFPSNGFTSFHIACKYNKVECLKYMLDMYPYVVDLQDMEQRTGLMLACKYGHARIVSMLLDSGANLQLNSHGRTAFHFACTANQAECLKLLLSVDRRMISRVAYSSDVGTGRTPLHDACGCRYSACCKLLLEHYAQDNYVYENGNTIEVGLRAVLNNQDNEHKTPLQICAESDNVENAHLLLEHIAFIDYQMLNEAKSSWLRNGNMEIVKILGEEIQKQNPNAEQESESNSDPPELASKDSQSE